MLLKKIELKGFKSFADRTVIDFSDAITCIVGPNGSGKSNITDAFRWVLGEQRYKTLRGSQMQDVIFNGTTARKPLGFAEVSIIFDNSTNLLSIAFDEVKATRRLYRSGESEYSINGASCRLKDIKELFMDTGIGVEGYSIIGQGRIDSILSTNKEERRLIFEEAAGIVKYRTRKSEAERKLARTDQNLSRISDIVAELAERVEPLKEQSAKAKIYRDLTGELKDLEVNILLYEIEQADEAVKIIDEQIKQKKKESEVDENDLNQMNAALNTLVGTLEVLEKKLGESLRKEGDNKALIAKEEGEIAVINERINSSDERLLRLKDTLSRDDYQNEQLSINYKELTNQIERSGIEQQSLEDNIDELNQTLTEIDGIFSQQIKQQSEIMTEQMKAHQIIEEKTQQTHKINAKDELIRERLKAIEFEFDKSESSKAELNQTVQTLESQIVKSQVEIESVDEKRSQCETNIKYLQQQTVLLENELFLLKGTLSQKKATLSALEEQEQNQEGFSFAVKKVLSWSAQDDGVYGSLKDLFTVEAKFYTAIETALGKNLQTIAVKDDTVVDIYIKRLKQEKAGRATFVPVSNVKPRSIPPKNIVDGFYGCAMHYVKCDKKISSAFEYMLSNVYFADTLHDAKINAKTLPRGSRVVTLDGDVVNSGGTLTGGSLSKKETGFLKRKQMITDLRQLTTEIADNINSKNQQISDNKAELSEQILVNDSVNAKLNQKKSAHAQLIYKLEAVNNNINLADEAAQNITKENEHIVFEIKQNTIQIETYQITIDKQQALLASLKEKADALENAHQKLIQKKNKIQSELTEKRIVRSAKTEALNAQLRQLDELRAQLDRFDTIKKNAQKEHDTLSSQREILDQLKAEKLGQIHEAKVSQNDISESLASQHKEMANKKTEISQIEKKIESIREKLSIEKGDTYNLSIELTRIETRRQSKLDHLWETYELTLAGALAFKHAFDTKDYQTRIRGIKKKLKALGDVNLNAIDEYDAVSERYEFLCEQQSDLIEAAGELKKLIGDIDKQMRRAFKEKLSEVNAYFAKTFSRLFGGGAGEIIIDGAEDILNAEIVIHAQPPGKNLQSLDLLSGGEKALTAIALLFAILKTKPTPFCILDEIEAALDDVNIFRFAEFLKDFIKDSQFIIITHRKGTMEIAQSIYGVTMQEKGVTSMLSVKLEDARALVE